MIDEAGGENVRVMAVQEGASDLAQPVDPDAPSLSRIYDYLLGGGHNFVADRTVANKVTCGVSCH